MIYRDQKKQTKTSLENLNIEAWELNRRKFLKGTLLAGAMTQIGFFTSCTKQLKQGNDILNAQQATILDHVLLIFFPNDGNGPDANDINAFGYFMWVLNDSLNRKTKDNEYIINGIGWLDDESIEVYKQPFIELSQEEKEGLIAGIMDEKWGKTWSSMLVTLIFEALLLDPIYGGNTNEVGWQWLNHTPGFPRPTEELRYERIMERQMKINTANEI